MKLRTKIFNVFLISNVFIVVFSVLIFVSNNAIQILSSEKKTLDLINRRFLCLVSNTLERLDQSLNNLRYSNDIPLLFIDDQIVKNFVGAKLNREIEKIKSDFPIIESIIIAKNGIVFFPSNGESFSYATDSTEDILISNNMAYLIHSLPVTEEISLISSLNLNRAFEEFIKSEKMDENMNLLLKVSDEGYTCISLSNGSQNMDEISVKKACAISDELRFKGLYIFVSKPKKVIYSALYRPIIASSIFLATVIVITYIVSKYLSGRITASISKVSQKMNDFRKREFKTIEIEEKFEDELRSFLEAYNMVSKELNKYVQATELIIEEKTRIIAKQNEKLKEAAITDELTKLHNRRYFNEVFPKDYHLVVREKMRLNFAIMDLDHFKKINDTYGHQAGDMCLEEFSRILRKHFNRKSDEVFRFGGEEFVVYYLSTERDNFLSKLEKLRVDVENTEMIYKDKVVKLTVSIGAVSQIPENPRHESILSQADAHLYAAKEKGRNRIVFSEDRQFQSL